MAYDGLAAGGNIGRRKMGAEAVAEIVAIMFMSRDFTHKAHLKTGSYAAHVALNGFYDGIVDLADALAETAQGKYGILDIPTVSMKGNIDKPVKGLEMHMEDILELGRACGTGAIKNIIDEIEALYLSTLYKLKELS